jgi:small subunit ribosomal protein S14
MKSKLEQDRKRRELVKKFEKTRNNLKSIIHNQSLDNNLRLKALKKLQKLPRNSSASRVKNRCVLTGRSGSVYRDFKVSRIFLRKQVIEGFIPGIKKSSW